MLIESIFFWRLYLIGLWVRDVSGAVSCPVCSGTCYSLATAVTCANYCMVKNFSIFKKKLGEKKKRLIKIKFTQFEGDHSDRQRKLVQLLGLVSNHLHRVVLLLGSPRPSSHHHMHDSQLVRLRFLDVFLIISKLES
jgi:hypothetical protein